MEGLLNVIEKRRAYRAISDEAIDDDVQKRILTAGTYAPSCFNRQPWRYLIATGDDARSKVQNALSGGNYWAKKAPMFILVITKPDLDCVMNDRREYALFDVGQSVMSMQYQAFHEGLIAHPLAGFDDIELKRVFEIPDEYILIDVLVIAHPGEDDSNLNDDHREREGGERLRKPQEEVISYDRWGW